MNRVRIWDLPVRIFHWLFAAAFLAAFAIATIGGDDSPLFPYHAMLGLTLVLLVVMRVIWGIVGTRWSRFGSLDLRPRALARYVGGATGVSSPTQHSGHNPATSWFLVAALLIVGGLGVTGYQMARGNEAGEDVHEVLAWTLLVLSAVHVAGVVWHRIRQRENLAVAMVTGYKVAEPSSAIRSTRPISALVFVALLAFWGTALAAAYDPASGRLTLPLLGTPLQLVEQEEGDRPAATGHHEGHEEEEDDD